MKQDERPAAVQRADTAFERYAMLVRYSIIHPEADTHPLHVAQTLKAYHQFLAAFEAL